MKKSEAIIKADELNARVNPDGDMYAMGMWLCPLGKGFCQMRCYCYRPNRVKFSWLKMTWIVDPESCQNRMFVKK